MSITQIVCKALVCPFGFPGEAYPYEDEDSNNVHIGVSWVSVIPVMSVYVFIVFAMLASLGIASSRIVYPDYTFDTGCKGNDTVSSSKLCSHGNSTYRRLWCSRYSAEDLIVGCGLFYGLTTVPVITGIVGLVLILICFARSVPRFCRSFQSLRKAQLRQQGAYSPQVSDRESVEIYDV